MTNTPPPTRSELRADDEPCTRGHLSEDDAFRAVRFWVIDFEGTTPRGHRPEPIEVAALAVQHRPGVGPLPTGFTFCSFIQPPGHAPLTPMDTAQTGIRPQDLADASPAPLVLAELESQVPEGPVLLVAHHAPVEAGFLYAYRDACPRLARTSLIDTVLLARTVHPTLDSYRLDALISHLKLPRPARRHRAMDDVEITARVFRQLLGNAARCGLLTSLADLTRIAGRCPKASAPHQPGLF
ncbi:3'-5' exonuclease [Streptomyces sp. ME19-01-6]|uniref:3'-5' exonuclease n=1 Tax=Streptomyces sp. ME19-01-6 TaxID=3028686 RepID=UPI0029B7D7DF|nr:3'-5' exonuclease [Streptomyces sp. ME19-01-6]MDX3224496.1 3'-5' exonuclease [Streptomyces sp. ME19-01-6]